ncbi:hypothetical protein PG994_010135 [Apiospora phragmitis]|uniref:Uncharacterized protein n=1 Tax=Apiospora phragmitis TaxID=2905665 RepID=A0ABR1TP20_9PEZI
MKRQQSRWNAVNTICLGKAAAAADSNKVTPALRGFHITHQQPKAASPSSSFPHPDNDNLVDDNTHDPQQQPRQKTQEEKQEEEEQLYHDLALRSLNYATTIKHRHRRSRKLGAVMTGFVEPLRREDGEQNLQINKRLKQRRLEGEEQATAQRREENQEEKRRVSNEKQRERRARKKKEREEQEEQEEQEQEAGSGATLAAPVAATTTVAS